MLQGEIKQSFKEVKNDLGLRPVCHQSDKRIEAHIFVSYVAYCLQATLKNLTRDMQIDFIRRWAQKLGRKISWIWTYPMKNYGRLQAPDVPQHALHAYLSFYRRAAPLSHG